ncbi:MAG: thiamine phosphate synthase, partial [Longimicrobiales bacterium]|nr:thiamine phosphate synthase [Longimicrobiales bacterium]
MTSGASRPEKGRRSDEDREAGAGRRPSGAEALARRLRLIVITDVELARPRPVLDVVRAAVAAGAPAVQLRAKGASPRELMEMGTELLPVAREAGALFFVNDRLDVALALGADGVHLGPDDLPVAAARRAVDAAQRAGGAGGPMRGRTESSSPEEGEPPLPFLIGASTDDPEQARALAADGADYIGCGTVFPTTTKADAGEAIGLDGLQRVAEAVEIPVVGIGGVDAAGAARIGEATGAAGIAVVGAVMGAEDVGKAV